MVSYDAIPREDVCTAQSPGRTVTPRRTNGGNLSNSVGCSSSTGLRSTFASVSSSSSSTRRRLSTVGGGRMDPSSAMLRLRTSLAGSDRHIYDDLDMHDDRFKNDSNTTTSMKNNEKKKTTTSYASIDDNNESLISNIGKVLHQIPAIALMGIFHMMVGIPFGVSYFPMYWSSHPGDGSGREEIDDGEDFHHDGKFPIPGKEAFGIRMFLFSTFIGQLVYIFSSGFNNPIGLQMVENIGFTKELAAIAISHQGFGIDTLSTVMCMFAISSILVGVVFFLLGHFKMGKIVYFFPTHVLIGLIGGIGILVGKTGLENTLSSTVSVRSLVDGWNHWLIVVALEIILRLLEFGTSDKEGQPRFALLSPIFFCMITPCFYFILFAFKIPISVARDASYFFPSLSNIDTDDGIPTTAIEFGTPWDLWKVIDFSKVSWIAILDSLPTMVALVLFSLIHVPINIPAFALSTKVDDVDMNKELIAHGFSNMLAGLGGGLQNYLAYTQSVLYDKSGGYGRLSGLSVAGVTAVLFVVGPDLASYVPRCMAGSLLLHVGIDLFLEGVWDSYGKFDWLEYTGIWLIAIVMSLYGMEAAMVMGGIAAVSTYAVQSVIFLTPIRGHMPATTLRSSYWNRKEAAETILNNPDTGRNRILVVQLQGHLFFGNTAIFTDKIYDLLCPRMREKTFEEEHKIIPIVLIMDFSLVLGIDSSAARAIVKLKDTIINKYNIHRCIFVTGSSEGFPTEFDLSNQLSNDLNGTIATSHTDPCNKDTSLLLPNNDNKGSQYNGSCVRSSLDLALMEAEDNLINMIKPCLFAEEDDLVHSQFMFDFQSVKLTPVEEKEGFISAMKVICPGNISDDDIAILFSSFEREIYKVGDLIWEQNDSSDSVKLLIQGQLIAILENEAGTEEVVPKSSMIGELGLVNGNPRMSTVKCVSKEAILYSMSRESFEELVREQPNIARYIDLICVKYLTLRVQHVSNRIFETRCLPI